MNLNYVFTGKQASSVQVIILNTTFLQLKKWLNSLLF